MWEEGCTEATSPSGLGHGEDLASGNGSSHAVSGDQGTQGVHGDLCRVRF